MRWRKGAGAKKGWTRVGHEVGPLPGGEMAKSSAKQAMDSRTLEGLLQQALTPVEPSSRFVQTLRARLVAIQGGGMSPAWTLLFAAAVAALLTIASLGLALRVLLGLLSLLGIISRRPKGGRRRTSPV